MHPASKQRSEGEKVRVGDDLILVSVSSERYLVSTLMGVCVKGCVCGGAPSPITGLPSGSLGLCSDSPLWVARPLFPNLLLFS